MEPLETTTPPCPLPDRGDRRVLSGVKVLEMCRIIAGPVVARILGEYGADVLKITSPHLSDVPFFQVDGNMGKRAADLDLKTPEGRQVFEKLLDEADVVVDGYRPGALEKLGYGPRALSERAARRGRGIVYVNENCFGYEGEWAGRPGWQQIADCVSVHEHEPKRRFTCVEATTTNGRADNGAGQRHRVGAGPLHGARRAGGAAVPHLRLRHGVHRGHRGADGALPPGDAGRLVAR